MVKSAQLLQKDETDKNRYQRVRDKLQEAETEVQQLIQELQNALADHDMKGKALKAEPVDRQSKSDPMGKGKGQDIIDAGDAVDGDDDEQGLPKTPAGDEHLTKRRAIKHRLREGFLVLHKVKFLQGDIHHVLGKSTEEDAAYQVAEELRRQLLRGMDCSFHPT